MKLSIIVPIYEVESYLRKCVDSLLNQDIDDYEIILVDDGSTDNSGVICDEYANKHHTSHITHHSCLIRVIHQPNAGLSSARNSGVKIANGDYLMFVDSDDYIEPNVLGELLAQMERDDLDALRFDYQNVRLLAENDEMSRADALNEPLTLNDVAYEVFEPYKRSHRLENDYSDEVTDGVTFLNTRMSTACYAVMFIIKRSLIYSDQTSVISNQNFKNITPNIKHQTSNILFTEKIYFEDTDWTPRMLCKANRVASTNTIVYNYLVREGSITNAVNRSKQQKVLDDKMRLVREMQRQATELKSQGKDNRWFSKMIAATVISIVGILSTQFYNERKDYLSQLKEFKIFPIQSHSLKARLINFSPRLAAELLHWKNG